MESDAPDILDRLLDGALGSYSSHEPRPGLERRVLDCIHAGGRRRFAFPRWAFAVAAAACLLVWAAILRVNHPVKPADRPVVVAVRPPVSAVPPATPELRRVAAIRPHRKPPLPRRPQFPTPTPITNEERTLLAFVARDPQEARAILVDAQRHSTEPIRIEEIRIEPLQSDGQP